LFIRQIREVCHDVVVLPVLDPFTALKEEFDDVFIVTSQLFGIQKRGLHVRDSASVDLMAGQAIKVIEFQASGVE